MAGVGWLLRLQTGPRAGRTRTGSGPTLSPDAAQWRSSVMAETTLKALAVQHREHGLGSRGQDGQGDDNAQQDEAKRFSHGSLLRGIIESSGARNQPVGLPRRGDPQLPLGDPQLPLGDPELPTGDTELPLGDPRLPLGDRQLPPG